MSRSNQYIVADIFISAEEMLKLYEGAAKNASVVARDGRRIEFPAHILRPFVTREGVSGSFAIYFDRDRKFQRIDRLA